jgi:hypothetical protein
MNVKIENEPRSFISRKMFFEFSVQCLCNVYFLEKPISASKVSRVFEIHLISYIMYIQGSFGEPSLRSLEYLVYKYARNVLSYLRPLQV